MTRRWLGSADVEVDETTGALLVKVGNADLKVDVADVDVAAIVAGIAGSGSSAKTLANVVTALANVARIPISPATEGGNLATIAGALAGSYRIGNGGSPAGTWDWNPVDVLMVDYGHTVYHCRYANGTVPGLISFDDGVTWEYLPANAVGVVDGIKLTDWQRVQIMRIGDDMNGVYVSAWGV
jgi:hypothetical protein